MATYEPWSADRASEIINEHMHLEGPAMPILHALQDTFGFVPQEAEPLMAKALNWSRAEVHGVVTFYHDFRRKPAGKHVLKLCAAEACQSMGSDHIAAVAQKALGIHFGETTADGQVTLEHVYCLGLCATAPSAMLDGKIVARVDEKRLKSLLAEAQR
jgi:formate dehydrogenase subunit gamma